MVPLRSGPAIGARIVVIVQSPRAMLVCLAGVTLSSNVCDMGMSGPPVMPCRMRNVTSMPNDVASPQSAEKMPKPVTAITNTRTAPKRAASQPVSGTMIASATA